MELQTDRIQLAIDVLKELEQKDLKQGFHSWNDGPNVNALEMSYWGSQNECGTTACIAGWLVLDPRIQKEGLKPHYHRTEHGYEDLQPNYANRVSNEAIMHFFGIGYAAFDHIFGPDNPNSLSAAIEKLEWQLIEGDA